MSHDLSIIIVAMQTTTIIIISSISSTTIIISKGILQLDPLNSGVLGTRSVAETGYPII